MLENERDPQKNSAAVAVVAGVEVGGGESGGGDLGW